MHLDCLRLAGARSCVLRALFELITQWEKLSPEYTEGSARLGSSTPPRLHSRSRNSIKKPDQHNKPTAVTILSLSFSLSPSIHPLLYTHTPPPSLASRPNTQTTTRLALAHAIVNCYPSFKKKKKKNSHLVVVNRLIPPIHGE